MVNPILPVEQQLFPILLEWLDPLEGSFAAKANKSDACTSVTGSLNCFLEPKDLSILYLSLEALSTDVTVFPISEIRDKAMKRSKIKRLIDLSMVMDGKATKSYSKTHLLSYPNRQSRDAIATKNRQKIGLSVITFWFHPNTAGLLNITWLLGGLHIAPF